VFFNTYPHPDTGSARFYEELHSWRVS
jgi:hypothetical protein